MRDVFFYALCAVLLGLAGTTVLARNLFRSALSLLGVLLCTAVLFLLLQAEMVALVQVMVYIGGIMIFVLYAVLLTSELGGRMAGPSPLKIGLALGVAALTLGSLGGLAKRVGASAEAPGAAMAWDGTRNIASMKAMGALMLDPKGFLIPFELVSVLLLAAMVGAIAVARGDKGANGDKGDRRGRDDRRGKGGALGMAANPERDAIP